MRRTLVTVLAGLEILVTCAVVACSLQLSHRLVLDPAAQRLASVFVRSTHSFAATTQHFAESTRRIAANGVQVRITIGDA